MPIEFVGHVGVYPSKLYSWRRHCKVIVVLQLAGTVPDTLDEAAIDGAVSSASSGQKRVDFMALN